MLAPDERTQIVALWNARSAQPGGCLGNKPPIGVSYLDRWEQKGYAFNLHRDTTGQLDGFGLYVKDDRRARSGPIVAPLERVYYELLLAFANWGLAQGLKHGCGGRMPGTCIEYTRLENLGIQIVTINHASGQLEYQMPLAQLRAAVTVKLASY